MRKTWIRRSLVSAAMPAALVLLSLPGAKLHAQGLRAGIAVSELVGPTGFESRTGLVLGAAFDFLRFGPVSISPEVLYAQLGGHLPVPVDQEIDDIRIDYFQIPVLAKIGAPIPGLPSLEPSLYGGGYLSFQTKCSFGFADGSDRSRLCTLGGLQATGIDGVFRDTDWGWVVGGGVNVMTNRIGILSIEARYMGSLTSITVSGSQADAKNRAWMLLLGWSPDLR
jgi:hypothetical protein